MSNLFFHQELVNGCANFMGANLFYQHETEENTDVWDALESDEQRSNFWRQFVYRKFNW